MLYENLLRNGKSTFINTETKSHEEWLKMRTDGIGGSDAGAVMGLNKYATPLTVYLSKKGMDNFKGNKATEWGNILEEPVRQKAREELGIEIETVPGMFTSSEYPFMNANLDGLVFVDNKDVNGSMLSGLGGHEIKTSKNGDGFGDAEVPDSYYAQVQHYMAVTGLPFFILTVFVLNRYEGKHYVIPRNEDFITQLIEIEKDFWENFVLTETMPAPTGNENEVKMIDSLTDLMGDKLEIELPSDCLPILDQERAVDTQIKQLEQEKNRLREELKIAIYDNAGSHTVPEESKDSFKATCGNYKVSWLYMEKSGVDTNALKKAGLYDLYSKKSAQRQLRITGGNK